MFFTCFHQRMIDFSVLEFSVFTFVLVFLPFFIRTSRRINPHSEKHHPKTTGPTCSYSRLAGCSYPRRPGRRSLKTSKQHRKLLLISRPTPHHSHHTHAYKCVDDCLVNIRMQTGWMCYILLRSAVPQEHQRKARYHLPALPAAQLLPGERASRGECVPEMFRTSSDEP